MGDQDFINVQFQFNKPTNANGNMSVTRVVISGAANVFNDKHVGNLIDNMIGSTNFNNMPLQSGQNALTQNGSFNPQAALFAAQMLGSFFGPELGTFLFGMLLAQAAQQNNNGQYNYNYNDTNSNWNYPDYPNYSNHPTNHYRTQQQRFYDAWVDRFQRALQSKPSAVYYDNVSQADQDATTPEVVIETAPEQSPDQVKQELQKVREEFQAAQRASQQVADGTGQALQTISQKRRPAGSKSKRP